MDKRHAFAVVALVLIISVASVALVAYNTSAQSNGGTIEDIPATATYVIKTDGVNIWAINYTGQVTKNETDAGTVIQHAIDNSVNGGIVFIKAGTYVLNTTYRDLRLKNRIKLIGEGYENTILKSINPEVKAGVCFESNYCEVRDLTLQGPGKTPVGGAQYPWGILNAWTIDSQPYAANGTKVLNCRITNWSKCIYFTEPPNTKHEFRGNIIENCRYGIQIKGSDYVIVSNNIISEVDAHACTLDSCQNVVVAQNTLRNWGKAVEWQSAIKVNAAVDNCESINVIGNTIIGGNFSTGYNGIGISGEKNSNYSARRVSITGNTLTGILGNLAPGIYLHCHFDPYVPNVQDIVVSSNSIKNFNVAIQSPGGKNIAIVGNVAVENNYHGIWVSSGSYVTIVGNVVKNNGQGGSGDGIFSGANNCLISGNIIVDDQENATQRYGIYLSEWAYDYFITGNTVKGNDLGEIFVKGSNIIVKNNFGYATENSGNTTLPAGATSVSFEHGLAGTPQIVTFSWKGDIVCGEAHSTLKLYVNSFDNTTTAWTEVGTSPYLNNSTANYIYTKIDGAREEAFHFADSNGSGTIDAVSLYLEIQGSSSRDDYVVIELWNTSTWQSVANYDPDDGSYQWINWNVTSILDTWTKINGTKMRFTYIRQGNPQTQNIYVRRGYLYVDYSTGQPAPPTQSWWSANSTHITVSTSSSSSVDHEFSWYAEYKP